MFRPLTYQERQDHPRRCTARRHDGQPCGRFAIVGGTVCTTHGGAAPQVRRKALLRRVVELDRAAQAEAAFNVLLPPELHPLMSGGGRGHRKAAKPPEATPPRPEPTFAGIANISRAEHLANQGRAIIDADPPVEPPSEPPVTRPESLSPERKPADSIDDRDRDMRPPSGPCNDQPVRKLMTLEEAVTKQTRTSVRRVTRRYR